MSLYVYCLSDEIAADSIEQAAGVAGERVRVIEIEGIKAVVSDFNDNRAEVSKENVLAHESVNRLVLSHETPLPFRFGSVVSQKQLEDFISSRRARLLEQLAEVRGAVEMSVKILWDAEARRRQAIKRADDLRPTGKEEAGPGAAFLYRKQREIAGDRSLKKKADEIAAWLDGAVSSAVRKSLVRVRPQEAIVVDAAHLVERTRLDEYRALVRRARDERDDLRFLASGEWPPYSFSILD